jgi:hypothetical protein
MQLTLRKIALALALGLTCVSYSQSAPYPEPSENDPPEECEYDENSVDEAVGEAIEAFRAKLRDCLSKASTLEATKACGDIE